MATRAHKAMMERNEWAPDSSGNLFAPVEYGTEVHGGWKKSSALGNVIRAGLGLGLSAGLIYLFRAPRGEPRQEEKIPAA